jgi:hypothetical protein
MNASWDINWILMTSSISNELMNRIFLIYEWDIYITHMVYHS